MTANLFLLYLAFIIVVIGAIIARFLGPRRAAPVLAGLTIWLVYVGALSYSGIVQDPAMRPPGALLVVGPVFVFVLLVLVRSSAGLDFALAFPIWLILGLQSFRIGVELLLHQIWRDGIIPRMLTYEGGNVDILIGLSAPLAAWLSTTGRLGQRLALIWNILGLVAIANVVVRAALTAPGPLNLIRSEIPNLAIGMFPFTYIAGLFAPLAVVLHVMAIRALRARPSGAADEPTMNETASRKAS